ncbi:hypothetical protein M408DRAFT_181451 [Serendipita vermifera MAFF 305830]|uniref:Uncharacterized protein n=1 Tax=Serendipita vermifera MAFF 305830 TaxID=933852 RepID=A0A0C2XBN5_SERVB|nr:hypothetical protein M408DRAFT_181451 [Serendipita vermifera MAFF 305830]
MGIYSSLLAVIANLNRSYSAQASDPETIKRNVEAIEAVSEAIKLMRHNITNEPSNPDNSFREYAAFCRDFVCSLKELEVAKDGRLAPLLSDPWVTALPG